MSFITREKNGSWRARYRDPDGRAHSKNFVRKGDAERFLTTIEHSKLTGAYVDPVAGKITFREYAEQWRSIQIHRPSTTAQVETNLRLHALPHLGHRSIATIRPTQIQGWVRGLESSLAPGTVGLVYGYVATIFKAAVRDRLIASTPCIGIKLPKDEPRQIQPLETEIVEKLIVAVPDRYRALVVLGAGTGLRQGEAFGLTLDRIDFLRRTLRVDRQLVLMPGDGPFLGPPKTKDSHRTIPLPQVVIHALADHLAKYPTTQDGFVFTNDDGQPIRRTRFSVMWRKAVMNSGAPSGTGYHALRHYYASLLIRHGESVKVIQSRLGHHDATETLNTYAHLWPDSEDRTRAAIDDILGSPASDTRQTVNENR